MDDICVWAAFARLLKDRLQMAVNAVCHFRSRELGGVYGEQAES